MSTQNGSLTIGKLAKQYDVNVETIRYYQRVGLMEAPAKPPNGYRRYSRAAGARLSFIKRAQKLGFSLREVRELLDLGTGRCDNVRTLAERKRNVIGAQIRDLQSIHDMLDQLISACNDGNGSGDCAIIDRLFDDNAVR